MRYILSFFLNYITILLILVITFSCVDETVCNIRKSSFIAIAINENSTFTSTRSDGIDKDGENPDNEIQSLRILVFDSSTKQLVNSNGNTQYNNGLNDIIHHPIEAGTYDFVFLANEAPYTDIENKLSTISNYSDLDKIAYPEAAFTSDLAVPMIQTIKSVKVTEGGDVILTQGTENINGRVGSYPANTSPISLPLLLELDRLGTRIDIILNSEENLATSFKGVTLTNIPNIVPLTKNYNNSASPVARTITRTFTTADDPTYFETATPETGFVWAKKVKRIILPANNFTPATNKDNATILTVNLEDKYSPTSELKISSTPTNDYTLPYNSWLEVTGNVKKPLELNIKASEWSPDAANWSIGKNRILNVSHSEVNITDFNGARISFQSNMPYVRVADKVYNVKTQEEEETEFVFNSLGVSDNYYNPSAPGYSTYKFAYDRTTGAGYMDILVNYLNAPGDYTYEITLFGAESSENTAAKLQKKITVHIKQEGLRYPFNPHEAWSTGYAGAFYKNIQKGERVITGQSNASYEYSGQWQTWKASVEYQQDQNNRIILSTTPSFDPNIGKKTKEPGDPENYPVIPNAYLGEDGSSVQGTGRIYFRIGLEKNNPNGTGGNATPWYGVVKVEYKDGYWNDLTHYLYIRQGENDDYLMRSTDPMIIGGQTLSRTNTRKFSAYNLTVSQMKNNPNPIIGDQGEYYYQIPLGGGQFVEYPSQGGAMFQWGLRTDNAFGNLSTYYRRAYFSTVKNNMYEFWDLDPGKTNNWAWDNTRFTDNPYWETYKNTFEVCPPGYRRPIDGNNNQIVYNETVDDVKNSELRTSLFVEPIIGDANPRQNTTGVLYQPVELDQVTYGFYADGFFDRRPITSQEIANSGAPGTYIGVSIDKASAAYVGTLIHNPYNKASLFFPSAGRRWFQNGRLEYTNNAGYYWTSSLAPGYEDLQSPEHSTPFGNCWGVEFSFNGTTPKSSVHTFGHSIRCVKD